MDGVNAETIVASFGKEGVVLNASTGQTYVNYFIKGLPKYMEDMIDYIVSISTNPIINKTVLKKKKSSNNELLIHGQNSQLPLQFTKSNIIYCSWITISR